LHLSCKFGKILVNSLQDIVLKKLDRTDTPTTNRMSMAANWRSRHKNIYKAQNIILNKLDQVKKNTQKLTKI